MSRPDSRARKARRNNPCHHRRPIDLHQSGLCHGDEAARRTWRGAAALISERMAMPVSMDHPFVVFALALVTQGLAVLAGDFIRRHSHRFGQGERHDFATVQTATLTLLALITGFSFSMAVSRYDQRKTLEEQEANAISTEYLRADLLPDDL